MCDLIENCVRPNGGCSVIDMSEYEVPPCFVDQKHLTGNLDPVAESPAGMAGSKARCDEPGHVLVRMAGGTEYGMHALEAFNLANDIRSAAVIAQGQITERP